MDSGGVTDNEWYLRIVSISVCLGVVVAVKRLWLGLFLGKKTYGKVVSLHVILICASASNCKYCIFIEKLTMPKT
jgi:hypothetical protein